MKRQELLDFLKDKISPYYYDILYYWTYKRRKFLFIFNRKFDITPTILVEKGYVIHKSKLGDFIIVYK